MRLGLGLGITTPRGGDPVDRALSGFKHIYDARKGSAFTDYGTGAADGTAVDVTHSDKWWTFNGSTSKVSDLLPAGSITLGASDEATFILVTRRMAASNPAAVKVAMSYKDASTGAAKGVRWITLTTGAFRSTTGDGTGSISRDTATNLHQNGAALVVVQRYNASTVEMRVNGAQVGGGSSRGGLGDLTPAVAAKLGNDATTDTAGAWFDGDIGLVATIQSYLSDHQTAALEAALLSAFA